MENTDWSTYDFSQVDYTEQDLLTLQDRRKYRTEFFRQQGVPVLVQKAKELWKNGEERLKYFRQYKEEHPDGL